MMTPCNVAGTSSSATFDIDVSFYFNPLTLNCLVKMKLVRCGYQYEHPSENSEIYIEGEKSSEFGSP
ncbi:hypothetical protein PTKIN_Ptkin15bG0068100 [Pterospermum kingtungense]